MTFQWPYLLLSLLLVPALIGLYALAQRRRRAYAVRFTNLELLGQVVGRGPGVRRHVPPSLFMIGMAALLISLARPTAVIPVPTGEATVIMVMDTSGSMRANDLEPRRMDAAKEAARSFVQSVPRGVRVGLVSFSHVSRVVADPTDNEQVLLRAIDSLVADGGTAIGDGLNLALEQLAELRQDETAEAPPSLVVLLSDGQSTHGMPPEEAAMRAREAAVRVNTIGIGQRGATPLVDGRLPVELDESTLQMIAAETGGQYFYAAETDELEGIYADLGNQVGWTEERTEVTALFSALGSLFMIAAGLLGLRWFQQLP